MNPFVVKHMKEKSIEGSGVKFTWGVQTGAELEPLASPFHDKESRSLAEGMAVMMPVYRILEKIEFIRNISNQILVFEK